MFLCVYVRVYWCHICACMCVCIGVTYVRVCACVLVSHMCVYVGAYVQVCVGYNDARSVINYSLLYTNITYT